MISDDLNSVAGHLSALVDGRGRLVMNAETARAVLGCLGTIAEQMAIFERNATSLDSLPPPATDPVRLERELKRLAERARGLASDAERWDEVAVGRAIEARIKAAVNEIGYRLTGLVDEIKRRRGLEAAEGAEGKESRARARARAGGQVVDLHARRAARMPAAPGGGSSGSAA